MKGCFSCHHGVTNSSQNGKNWRYQILVYLWGSRVYMQSTGLQNMIWCCENHTISKEKIPGKTSEREYEWNNYAASTKVNWNQPSSDWGWVERGMICFLNSHFTLLQAASWLSQYWLCHLDLLLNTLEVPLTSVEFLQVFLKPVLRFSDCGSWYFAFDCSLV